MRAITTATAASVLSVDRKSLDNLLARIESAQITAGRQGLERRIPMSALEDIALTVEIVGRLSIPARDAYQLARQLLGRDAIARAANATTSSESFVGSASVGPFIQLGIDIRAFRADLQAKLEQAIESHVRPRRGRPRKPHPVSEQTADA